MMNAKQHCNSRISDTFGRVHDYLRISLTERCNLRCHYCMPAEGIRVRPRSHFMTCDEVAGIAATFVGLGVKKIRLTGGEPLVRHDAKKVIAALSELPVELAISTNGILVHQFIDTFQACGIRSVNVSLDSLQKERFSAITRRNYFDPILANIRLLISKGFHVKLNAVIMRGINHDELNDFVAFTKDHPVHFRFIEFMPFGGNDWHWDKGYAYKEMMADLFAAYGERIERIEDRQNDCAKNYRINGFAGTFAVISSVTHPFCGSCNRLRLTADGKLKNCLFSKTEADLLSRYRRGEDLRPYILENVSHKKEFRGGMASFGQLADPSAHANNRCMTAIGG